MLPLEQINSHAIWVGEQEASRGWLTAESICRRHDRPMHQTTSTHELAGLGHRVMADVAGLVEQAYTIPGRMVCKTGFFGFFG